MKGAAFSLPNISVILRADSRLIRPDLRQLQPDNLAAHAQRAENERVHFLRVRSISANALKPAAVFPSTWCIVVHMSGSSTSSGLEFSGVAAEKRLPIMQITLFNFGVSEPG